MVPVHQQGGEVVGVAGVGVALEHRIVLPFPEKRDKSKSISPAAHWFPKELYMHILIRLVVQN
jgi:hypothetical protein